MRSGCSATASEPAPPGRRPAAAERSLLFPTPPFRRVGLPDEGLTVRSQRDARLIYLELPDAIVLRPPSTDGKCRRRDSPVGSASSSTPCRPKDLRSLSNCNHRPGMIRVLDGTDGLDGLPGFTPRPDGVGVQGSHTSELVVVARSFTV